MAKENKGNKAPETEKPKTGDNTATGDAANVPATVAPKQTLSDRALTIGGRAFKVTKQVTMPLLKHPENSIVAFTITSAMFMGKEIKNKKNGETISQPAPMVNVIDANTGAAMQYILPAVFKGVLEDDYPKDSYIGKSFAVNKLPIEPGKRYKPVEVVEIELEA